MHWLSVLGRAIVAFVATNIDDVFLLSLFFAQKNVRAWHVVAGQYIGLAALIAISLVGFFAPIIIPHYLIGLLGVVPILIGLKKLFDWKRGDGQLTEKKIGSASILTVAAVTFANGGDNIAIYVPLFANSDTPALFVTLATFSIMIALLCVAGYYIGNHSAVRRTIDHYSHVIVPFVLIGLGVYIIIESFT